MSHLCDELGDRMKNFYENRSQTFLQRRTPVVIRIDGKAFHTFTCGLKKPFDYILTTCMEKTMQYLCENIQGCIIGYTQSDEITIVLKDYYKLTSDAWFDYNVQKICSISASMASMKFNKEFERMCNEVVCSDEEDDKHYIARLISALNSGAVFDARCFNIPKEEVSNMLLWRQLDARRNSVNAIARTIFSDNELYKKSEKDVLQMLNNSGNSWESYPTHLRYGTFCYIRNNRRVNPDNGAEYYRNEWFIDRNQEMISGGFCYFINNLVLKCE